jgi:hypothetical protein
LGLVLMHIDEELQVNSESRGLHSYVEIVRACIIPVDIADNDMVGLHEGQVVILCQ